MPLALILGLIGLLILQLFLPRAPDRRSSFIRMEAPRPTLVAVTPVAIAPEILQRPIFTPTRGPGGASAAAAEPQFADYALVGVARARGFAAATLNGPGGRVVEIRPGQALLGWRLSSVTTDSATFTLDGQRRTLVAGTGAGPASGAAPAPSVSPFH